MNIKTITSTDGVNEVDFGSGASRFYWFQNLGTTTVHVSGNADIVAGADGVAELAAGDSVCIETLSGKVYVLGAGKVQIHNTGDKFCPFKNAPAAGGGAYERYYVYNNGVELNGHTLTIYHKSDSSKKDTNWIYINGFYLADISSDKIINNGYSKLCVNVMSDSTKWNYTPKYLKLLCTDESAATLSVNDYSPNGNVLKSLDIISYPDTVRAGTIYKLDVSDLSEFYVHLSNVNADTYILGVWLEREERAKGSMNLKLLF